MQIIRTERKEEMTDSSESVKPVGIPINMEESI